MPGGQPWLIPARALPTPSVVLRSTFSGSDFIMDAWRSPLRRGHRYTYAEYLSYEQDSGLKHEYANGEISAMAGGSRRHNALASRISAALEQGRGPIAFQTDQKVRILEVGRDGERERHTAERQRGGTFHVPRHAIGRRSGYGNRADSDDRTASACELLLLQRAGGR